MDVREDGDQAMFAIAWYLAKQADAIWERTPNYFSDSI
jgi:hypothetical protein